MSEVLREEFIHRIDSLRDQITHRHDLLNIEVIWLFVATLSCWSVDVNYLRFIAVILVLVFFVSKISRDKKNDKTFIKLSEEIREDLDNSDLEGDAKKARYHDLDDIKNNLLSIKSVYKLTPIFLLGYLFWAVSIFIFLNNIVP